MIKGLLKEWMRFEYW